MNAPGAYSLGTLAITVPATYVGAWYTGLDGMIALTAQLAFLYGSGGSSVTAYLQTSFDQGNTAVDVAAIEFAAGSSATVLFNVTGTTPRTSAYTPTDGALSVGTILDGLLGDRVRLKAVAVGTFAGSTQLIGNFVAR